MDRAHLLTIARLGFACWSNDDLALANTLWSDPRVSALIGGPFTEGESAKSSRGKLPRSQFTALNTGQSFFWKTTGTWDAPVCVHTGGTNTFYELGFHLRPAYWGRGLAEEAGRAAAALAFETLTKLGFRFTHEEFYLPTGLMHPSYLLRRDDQV